MLSIFLSIFLGFFLFDVRWFHLFLDTAWGALDLHGSCSHGLKSAAFLCNGDQFGVWLCIGFANFLQVWAAVVFWAIASSVSSGVSSLLWSTPAVGFFGCRSWTALGFGFLDFIVVWSSQIASGRDSSGLLGVWPTWTMGLAVSFYLDGRRSWRRRLSAFLIIPQIPSCPEPFTSFSFVFLSFSFVTPFSPDSGTDFAPCGVYRYRWRAARKCYDECEVESTPFFAERLSVLLPISWNRALSRVLSDPLQPLDRILTIWYLASLPHILGPIGLHQRHLDRGPWSFYLIWVALIYVWWFFYLIRAAPNFVWLDPISFWVDISNWMDFPPNTWPGWQFLCMARWLSLILTYVYGFGDILCLVLIEW
ncbi:hypothetical protein V6N13_034375 [Hibiscus sabdariffa]|uniref:Uncharacterized protein n=1 Tax=Hibiscus sabdariffa TaxID=183260 RepID=A0ABR2P339_9ROSI